VECAILHFAGGYFALDPFSVDQSWHFDFS
jgi:hypothetical protein